MKPNNEQAFPNYTIKDGGIWSMGGGMTLRDYFANTAIDYMLHEYGNNALACENAYKLADAMLEERNK